MRVCCGCLLERAAAAELPVLLRAPLVEQVADLRREKPSRGARLLDLAGRFERE